MLVILSLCLGVIIICNVLCWIIVVFIYLIPPYILAQ